MNSVMNCLFRLLKQHAESMRRHLDSFVNWPSLSRGSVMELLTKLLDLMWMIGFCSPEMCLVDCERDDKSIIAVSNNVITNKLSSSLFAISRVALSP